MKTILKSVEEWVELRVQVMEEAKKKPMALERRQTTVLTRGNASEASIPNSPPDVALFQPVKRTTPTPWVAKLSKICPS